VKTRFAPSPTGLLHVGNGRPALVNWLFARKLGGSFLLRLDDTDTARNTEANEAAIHQDLAWLGLDWDETFRQSDRLDLYAEAAETLKAAGRLYPCFESEEELRYKREQRLKRGQAPIYDRAMLKLTTEQRANAEAGGKRPYWRFRLSNGAETWQDLVLGQRQVKLTAVSDPVLIRADGTPLYTLTSVVDDMQSGVTHVVRGEDHVTNTGVQMDLISALGGNSTKFSFAHLPLLLDEAGAAGDHLLSGASRLIVRPRADVARGVGRGFLVRTVLGLLAALRHAPIDGDEPPSAARHGVRRGGAPVAGRRHGGVLAGDPRQPRPADRGARAVGCGSGDDRATGDRGRGRVPPPGRRDAASRAVG